MNLSVKSASVRDLFHMKTNWVPAPADKTMTNLLAAYSDESNAAARYNEFACRADDEGFHNAASLFRAVARAEQVHANNHASVIENMGQSARADRRRAVVRSTQENLRAAILNEQYERGLLYPGLIKEAEHQPNPAAAHSFVAAQEVEAGHESLFKSALAHLDGMRIRTAYCVCAVCGSVSAKPTFEPVCPHSRDDFEIIT